MIDGHEKVTGAALYTDDLRFPRMLHGAFVRSPHPHARILSIDASEALALEGVQLVLTGADLPTRYGVIPVAMDENALAVDTVRFTGDEVAAVVARDREIAREAARRVRVEYELLEPVLSIEDALDPEKPLLHPERRKASNVLRRVHQVHGDPEAGFAQAEVVIEAEYDYPGSTHVALETHCAVAQWDGRLTLWSSTQIPHYLQRIAARVLDLDQAEVRVRKPKVGAGYGGKSDVFATELCAAEAARRLGRPVKFMLDREEVFYAHRGRHRTRMKLKMGVTREGKLTAAHLDADAEGGAYASYGVVTAYYLGVFLSLPYRLDDFSFTARRLYTNHPPCGPKRGHGAIQPRFALECHIDRLAEAIGMDPAELRRRNSVQPDTHTVNGLRVTSVGLTQCIDAVVEASGYGVRKLGPKRGLGLAASTYMCGALHPIYKTEAPQSAVQICADRSGRVSLLTGTADIGQGSSHVLAKLVAERLGIPLKHVRVLEADTDLTPVDLGAYSSRITFMAGNAALSAADQLAAVLDPSLPFCEAVEKAEAEHGTLAFVGHYTPPKIGSRFRRQSVGPSPAYSFTAAVAEVEVDTDSGRVTIHRIWCAHDCGKALDRRMVEGQIEGSVYMGVGEALLEEQRYDGPMLVNPSILECKIPTIHDTPEIVALIVETEDPEGPLGAKEAGEGPQLPVVPAIANAIHDAIGVRMDRAPFTPDRVWRTLKGQD